MRHSTDQHNVRAALIIAHPGHELRAYGWVEKTRPLVFVLTDGSAHSGQSRIHSTTKILHATGATAGSIYGALTDRELYAAMLDHDHSRFIGFVDEIAATLLREHIECVVGDAREGYNPGHDVCRLLINAAVKIVNRRRDTRLPNYDFTLVGRSDYCADARQEDSIRVRLDDDEFARKISAARNYPELKREVEAALGGAGTLGLRNDPETKGHTAAAIARTSMDSFRVECLCPVDCDGQVDYLPAGERPFYETYGEKRVADGLYADVLRYREHMLPLAEALNAHAARDD